MVAILLDNCELNLHVVEIQPIIAGFGGCLLCCVALRLFLKSICAYTWPHRILFHRFPQPTAQEKPCDLLGNLVSRYLKNHADFFADFGAVCGVACCVLSFFALLGVLAGAGLGRLFPSFAGVFAPLGVLGAGAALLPSVVVGVVVVAGAAFFALLGVLGTAARFSPSCASVWATAGAGAATGVVEAGAGAFFALLGVFGGARLASRCTCSGLARSVDAPSSAASTSMASLAAAAACCAASGVVGVLFFFAFFLLAFVPAALWMAV